MVTECANETGRRRSIILEWATNQQTPLLVTGNTRLDAVRNGREQFRIRRSR
jgi:hypothetical protein